LKLFITRSSAAAAGSFWSNRLASDVSMRKRETASSDAAASSSATTSVAMGRRVMATFPRGGAA
jgi:hypothetical protein